MDSSSSGALWCWVLLWLGLVRSNLATEADDTASQARSKAVLSAFDRWAGQSLIGPGIAAQMRTLDQGLALAKARRTVLLDLIQKDPQQALAASISPAIRQHLPPRIAAELEVPVSGRGDYSVVCALGAEGQPAAEPIRRYVRLNGQTFRAFVYGKRLNLQTQYGIPLSGVALDGNVALEDQTTETVAPRSLVGLSRTVGPKKVLIIRVDFSDLPGDPDKGLCTAEYVQSVADSQIGPYFERSSYGLTSLITTVTPRLYRMPNSAAYYAVNNANYQLHSDATTAASQDYALAEYDRLVVLFSKLSWIPNSQITYGGLGEIGGSFLWVNGEFNFRVLAHELGHTYGLRHAGLWQVHDENPISEQGSHAEYGDDFDSMGSNSANDPHTDYNPWFKHQLHWIGDDQVQTITASGTYRVYRFDDAAAAGTLALKVAKDGRRDYWIACRRNFTSNASMQHGAYIVWAHSDSDVSDLLDTTTPGDDVHDAALAIGAYLVDPAADLTISPVAEGGVLTA